MTTVLSREDIIRLINQTPPLVEDLRSPEQQIQPNGVDLTVRDIALLTTQGKLGQQNQTRILSATSPLVFDGMGGIDLISGCYLITYNEIVNLPKDIMALAFPRSSLLRCGVNIHTAVWDAGYSGRAQSLMVVYNPAGFRLFKDARVVQLVFFRLSSKTSEGYKGMFQKENM
ncbi:MAG: deoxyuridine 5'-triphosphate nucleotidohydrolase [Chloroflexi bacterium]|nr:deoxyuridine 5'-triphosphate nucleotidohydrolase [Chloroflexota bacterium]MBM3174510.1 deoxyuridine 5'-triphosphate nucleotidohydrolase [Chloroflexota bacterium]MBM4449647.1 deoxyuridine 5'-triphosphate nucleotidohydrolase [Chloroflexota bacterium]